MGRDGSIDQTEFLDLKIEAWLSERDKSAHHHQELLPCDEGQLQESPHPDGYQKRSRQPSLRDSALSRRKRLPLGPIKANHSALQNCGTMSTEDDNIQQKARKNPARGRRKAPPASSQSLDIRSLRDEDIRGRSAERVDEEVSIHYTVVEGRQHTKSGYIDVLRDAPLFSPSTLPSQKTKSSIASRSTSPTKTVADLAMARPPIKFFEAGNDNEDNQPVRMQELFRDMMRVRKGFGLLPLSLKDEIIAKRGRFEDLDDVYFDRKPGPPGEEDVLLWTSVQKIYQKARTCSQDNDSEASWGETVYSRIFEAAVEIPIYAQCMGWKNITTARIEPRDLLPNDGGQFLASKMVDYALFLQPSANEESSIQDLLRSQPSEERSINQTRHEPIRYRPITVSVEVKVPGAGKNDAKVQLGIWVAAQIKRLNGLGPLGDENALGGMIFPLLSVEGHDWRLYIAYQNQREEIIILGYPIIGDTSSIWGIYKIIYALRLLADWSVTKYKPWFNASILRSGQADVT